MSKQDQCINGCTNLFKRRLSCQGQSSNVKSLRSITDPNCVYAFVGLSTASRGEKSGGENQYLSQYTNESRDSLRYASSWNHAGCSHGRMNVRIGGGSSGVETSEVS